MTEMRERERERERMTEQQEGEVMDTEQGFSK